MREFIPRIYSVTRSWQSGSEQEISMNQRDRAQRRLNEQRAKAEREAIARQLKDKPNERKLRAQTTERVGCLASWIEQINRFNEERGLQC